MLYYNIRSQNIVRDLISKIDSLEMLYAGERIENLTATKIIFLNGGNDRINGSDIAIASPLTVNVKDEYKILDAKAIYYNPNNQFSLKLSDDKSKININFDYLAKNEGAIIQLLHTGKSEKDIEIQGIVKDSGMAPIRKNYESVLNLSSRIQIGFWFGVPIFFIVITVADGSIFENIKAIAFFLMMSLGIIYLILKDRLPKGFEKFQDEILK